MHREGPQVVTRHGEEVAVVVSIEEYRRLTSDKPTFKEFLLDVDAPDLGALELERSPERRGSSTWLHDEPSAAATVTAVAFLLDTKVVSEARRPAADSDVRA